MPDLNENGEFLLVFGSFYHDFLITRNFALEEVIFMADELEEDDDFLKFQMMMFTKDLIEDALSKGKDLLDDLVFHNALLHIRHSKAFDSSLRAWKADKSIYPVIYLLRQDVEQFPDYQVVSIKNKDKDFSMSDKEHLEVILAMSPKEIQH